MRGICWEGGREIEPRHLDPAAGIGADWISQTPFGWCRSLHDPDVVLAADRAMWGECDSGLVATARWARARGIHTLLKPHVWVHHGWPGDIRMQSDADWRQWFAAYERFIVHYARLAESAHMEALAVGTELASTTERESDWRHVIAAVRAVYHGELTYCANWNEEAERVRFWDALDFVGVQAYYPLGTSAHPPIDSIRAAWKPVAKRLESLANRTQRPVVLTEVGYKSVTGALSAPWEWDTDGEQDLDLQRDAYQALFEALWDRPWLGGIFIWKWHPRLVEGYGRAGKDFTPQGKPALDVVRSFYCRDASGTSPNASSTR